MSRTIVQEYGPIYGEAVNGTVMGRPNGSVFVPSTNTINLSYDEGYIIRYSSGFYSCESGGLNIGTPRWQAVAIAQDLASNIEYVMYSDSGLTNIVGSRTMTAGNFNLSNSSIPIVDDTGLSPGDTIYFIAYLMNNGTPVAVSDVIELELVQ